MRLSSLFPPYFASLLASRAKHMLVNSRDPHYLPATEGNKVDLSR